MLQINSDSSGGKNFLIAREISMRFGGLRALSSISCDVKLGSIYGIIGPNGAGKTTFFNILAGVIRPTTGMIEFNGNDITNVPAYKKCRLGIGRTFQSAQAFERHSIVDNILAAVSGGHIGVAGWYEIGVRKKESDIVERILTKIRLWEKRDDTPAALNNLEKQFLSIGMSLINHPKILLLDEPSGGLTESELRILSDFLREINNDGITLVVIDHKMKLIVDICDSVSVLSSGQLIAFGNPRDVLADETVKKVYLGGGI